jgi:hypothetical protein
MQAVRWKHDPQAYMRNHGAGAEGSSKNQGGRGGRGRLGPKTNTTIFEDSSAPKSATTGDTPPSLLLLLLGELC